jgi:hypothetical protein
MATKVVETMKILATLLIAPLAVIGAACLFSAWFVAWIALPHGIAYLVGLNTKNFHFQLGFIVWAFIAGPLSVYGLVALVEIWRNK